MTNARRLTAHAIPADDPTQSRSDPHRCEPSQNDRLTPTHRPSSSPMPASTLTRTRHRTSTPLRRAPIGVPDHPIAPSHGRTPGTRSRAPAARSPDRTHALTLLPPAQITPVQSIHARDPSGWGGPPLANRARAPTAPLSVDRAIPERRQHEVKGRPRAGAPVREPLRSGLSTCPMRRCKPACVFPGRGALRPA